MASYKRNKLTLVRMYDGHVTAISTHGTMYHTKSGRNPMCCKRQGNALLCNHNADCIIRILDEKEDTGAINWLSWMYVFDGYLKSTAFTGFGDAVKVQVQGKWKNGTGEGVRWKGGLTYNYIGEARHPVPMVLS